jgi:hypothetical protein
MSDFSNGRGEDGDRLLLEPVDIDLLLSKVG